MPPQQQLEVKHVSGTKNPRFSHNLRIAAGTPASQHSERHCNMPRQILLVVKFSSTPAVVMLTSDADILTVKPLESHKYTVNFERNWCIGTVPNGGYTTTAFMLVASKHMQHTHPKRKQNNVINLHLEFMRRTAVGEAIFTVKDVKMGSRVSNLHLTLSQKEHDSDKLMNVVEGYFTMSDLSAEDGLSLQTGYEIFPKPLPVSLSDLAQNRDKNYIRRGRDPFADFRRAGQNMMMHLMRPERRPNYFPKALIDQWVRFRPHGQDGRHTNDALGFVVDVFPQIIESYVNPDLEEATLGQDLSKDEADDLIKNRKQPHAKYWYPTLSLNLDVKKLLPKEGVEWLFVRVQAKDISNGRFDLQVEVYDESNDLVALSTHSSLVVNSSRNTTRGWKKQQTSKI